MQLFFYCNAITDDARTSRKITGDSPAATRKVFGLCRACRTAGIDARIVSMGRGRTGRFGWHGVEYSEVEGVPIYFGPMLHVPVLSYLITTIWLLWFARKNGDHTKRQVHLFYNQLTLYLPALMWLYARGYKTYVDIEDAPIDFMPGKSKRLVPKIGANASPRIFSSYISGGALLANNTLVAGTSIRPTLTYYGAIAGINKRSEEVGYPMNILISGTLEPATGMTLLAQSLEIIDRHEQSKNIVVFITGQGDSLTALHQASGRLKHVIVKVLGRVSEEDYHKTLAKADVGLSLKLVGGSYADSTFPSKTIEYAENGLMLISTDINDVRSIFGNSVHYLTTNSPAELADLILTASKNPKKTRMLGHQVQQVVNEQLSYPQVGEMLKHFFFGIVH